MLVLQGQKPGVTQILSPLSLSSVSLSLSQQILWLLLMKSIVEIFVWEIKIIICRSNHDRQDLEN